MNQIRHDQKPPEENEAAVFSDGFPLAVTIVLIFMIIVIAGLVVSYQKTTNAASARLVYMAARTKAIEFTATGDYRVPQQADLIDLIGETVNQDAVIEVIDEDLDANIDYIIYHKDGWVTTYSPGDLKAEKEK